MRANNEMFQYVALSGRLANVSANVAAIQGLVPKRKIEIFEASFTKDGFFRPLGTYEATLHTPSGLVIPVTSGVVVNEMREVNHGAYTFRADTNYNDFSIAEQADIVALAEKAKTDLALDGTVKSWTLGKNSPTNVKGFVQGRLEEVLSFIRLIKNNQHRAPVYGTLVTEFR